MRLTLWYVAAMVVVLGLYGLVVYSFVNRGLSDALDQQLRQDLYWASASLFQTPDGSLMLNEPEQLDPQQALPSAQVWSADGAELLFRNAEAAWRPIPGGESIAAGGMATVQTDTVPMRVRTQRHAFVAREGAVRDERVIVQVGRSEAPASRELALILLLGLPLAIVFAGLGGYTVARRALAPIERLTAHARTITAERLGERLPVDDPEDEMGRLAAVVNETRGRLEDSVEQVRRLTAGMSRRPG